MTYRTQTTIDQTPTANWTAYIEGQPIATALDRVAAISLLRERCAAEYDLLLDDEPIIAFRHNTIDDTFFLELPDDVISTDSDSFLYNSKTPIIPLI